MSLADEVTRLLTFVILWSIILIQIFVWMTELTILVDLFLLQRFPPIYIPLTPSENLDGKVGRLLVLCCKTENNTENRRL